MQEIHTELHRMIENIVRYGTIAGIGYDGHLERYQRELAIRKLKRDP